MRRELAGARRVSVALAIGFAFVVGLGAAFFTQVALAQPSSSVAVAARAPRTVTDRSSSLDTRSTPDALPSRAANETAPATKRAKRPSPPTTSAASNEGATPVATPTESDSIEGKDLLGEGLDGVP